MLLSMVPIKRSVIYLSPSHSVAFAGSGADKESVIFNSTTPMAKEHSDAFSVCGYVKLDSEGDWTYIQRILGSGTFRGWTFQYVGGSMRMRFISTVATDELEVGFAWTPSTATWYFLSFTKAAGTIPGTCTFYADAASKTPTTIRNSLSATIVDTTNLEAGAYSKADAFYLQGNICWLSFWNKELSGTEVTELYNSGTPIDPRSSSAAANLEEFVPFGTGDTFPNLIGRVLGWDGVMTNMAADDIEADFP